MTALGMTGSSAWAQSSVTLYGIVDAAFLYTSKSLSPGSGVNSGAQWALVDSGALPSSFGIMGKEDLGGGISASFDLENGFSAVSGAFNDSNGNLFGRQAWVALKSNWGELKAGLQYSPFFLALYETDARAFSQFGSGLVSYVNNALATGIFNANAVSYTSPTVDGFRGSILFALGGQAGNFSAGRQYSMSLDYQIGGLLLNAAFYDGNSGGTVSTPVPTTEAFDGRTFGAAYRYGRVSAKIAFVNYRIAGSFDNNVYGAGLDFQVTPQVDLNGGVWYTSDQNISRNHSILAAVGTQYFLSKATTLYCQVGLVNNHGAMESGISINGALNEVSGTTVGANLGIRHMF